MESDRERERGREGEGEGEGDGEDKDEGEGEGEGAGESAGQFGPFSTLFTDGWVLLDGWLWNENSRLSDFSGTFHSLFCS